MIINTVSAINPYPSERFFISINPIEPALDNARFGTRFIYDYYNTGEEKLILSPAPSLSSATDTFTQPTCFISLPDSFPVTWTPGHDKQYAFLSFLAATSAITVYPTHPYPKITKLANNHLVVSAGLMPYQYYDYEIHREEFRKTVDVDNILPASTYGFTFTSAPIYRSVSYRNYPLYLTKNARRGLSTFVPKRIIDNSLKIEVPLVSATDQEDLWYYTLFDSTSNNTSTVKSTGTLAGMYMEEISGIGVDYPYTTTNSINYNTGKIVLNARAPLLFAADEYVTVTCETSAVVTNTSVASAATISPNLFRLRSTLPIWLNNYPFKASGSGYSIQDAFTISFNISGGIINNNLSSVDISSIMHDNFYQTTYDMPVNRTVAVKRFVERTEDFALSAYDVGTGILYGNTQWMPASATMRMINDGLGNNHTIGIQMSTVGGGIYEAHNDVNFILNGKNIIFNLSITEQTDLSARASALIFPSADETLPIKWSVFPPENIVLRNTNSGEIIQQNTFYPGETFDVDIFNLGVDRTVITLYSQEYDVSAQTFWFPSSAIYNDLYLNVSDNLNDNNEVKTGQLSAFIARNGLNYRVPETGNISWAETLNDSRGNMAFRSGDLQFDIVESSMYPSTNNYSLINLSATTNSVDTNPKNITFNVNCNFFNEYLNLNANKLISMREYPYGELLTMDFKNSADSIVRNTEYNKSIVYTTPGIITLSAVYPDIVALDSSIRWELSSPTFTTLLTGVNASFYLSSDQVNISLSALNGKPFYGNFKYYNFTDYLKIFYNPSLSAFDYISFPENRFFPHLELNFNNYSESYGVSAFDACHTESFYFSATPGFNKYVWNVGNITKETSTNSTIIDIKSNNISSTNQVIVSAFNEEFLTDGFASVYNVKNSDSSTKFNQPVNFVDFPTITATIEINNDLINTDLYRDLPTVFAELSPPELVVDYNLNLVLSSVDGIQFKALNTNNPGFTKLVKIGIENQDFIIKEDSFNIFQVFLSGNVVKNIAGFDFCGEMDSIVSNSIQISAYNGPNLNLYIDTPVLSVGELVNFYNISNTAFNNSSMGFSAFYFDKGDGIVVSAPTSAFSETYAISGFYSPALTGILYNGQQVEKTWEDLIFVKNSFDDYDANINRELEQEQTLPYSLNDILIKPNAWQYASVINDSFNKIQTNLQAITANAFSYDVTFPLTNALYLGDRFGTFKWADDLATNISANTLSGIKSIQVMDNIMLALNGNNIQVFDISETPSLMFSTNKMGDSEVLKNPVKLHYVDGTLYVLDREKKIFFVCEFDLENPQTIKVTNYWGGPGIVEDSTKLNDPVDFTVDSNGSIYIVDAYTSLIKVYNNHLNWIQNIDTGISRINSIDIVGNLISLTNLDGNTYIMDGGALRATIYKMDSTKSILNPTDLGLIYIIRNNILDKCTIDGTTIASWELPTDIIDIDFRGHTVFVAGEGFIAQIGDTITYISIYENTLDTISFDSILVSEHEFVTDYIFNDSISKIIKNIETVGTNISNKFAINLDVYGDVDSISVEPVSAFVLPSDNYLIGINEPVNYDTINRGIRFIYSYLELLNTRTNPIINIPSDALNYRWDWRSHYIDNAQYPSIFKNPVSWRELLNTRIPGTVLSSVSSWCVLRDDSGGNHSEICWNYQYMQCNGLMPISWESTECGTECSRVFTWEDLERECCIYPDYIFADTISAC